MGADEQAKVLEELSRHTDLARRLELVPPSAQARGLYFRNIERVLDAAGRRAPYDALFPERFSAVSWYPLAPYLRRLVAAGAILAGPERAHAGMFEVGHRNAIAFSESLLGRVLLRLLSRDPRRLLKQGLAARRQSSDYGQWNLEFPREREAVVTMTEEYTYIESYLVGAAKGTFDAVGIPVKVEVILRDAFNGQHILRW